MPDENQTEQLMQSQPDPTGPGVPTPPPADSSSSNQNFSSEAAESKPTSSTPAATASSFRDIIAERLARKAGTSGENSRPMAHSSDVERSPERPTPKPIAEMPIARAEDVATEGGSMPSEIEEVTRSQEISDSTSTETASEPAPSGSRERARLRQQERAELRRGGPRQARAFVPEEHAIGESEFPASSENIPDSAEPTRDQPLRLERRDQRPDRDRPERPAREDRPAREERQTREQRPAREERPARPERPAREERPVRDERPARPVAPAIEKRDARKVLDRTEPKPMAQSIKNIPSAPVGPASTERSFETARVLANKTGISVVIPLFNEQDSLRELTAALKQQLLRLAGARYEIIYINDGSTDRSGEILQDILATSSRVTALNFRRNLGKSAALAAGFAEAQYGIVITMDADLQDDPHEFVNLIAKLAEGYDLVTGWKKKRHDPISKTAPSKFFNVVTGLFSGIKLHDFNCGLKAYRKEVTDSLQVYGEMHRYLPALAHWQGFRVAEIPVVHHPRKFGKSKFGSSRFFKGFLDLITIVFTNRYGRRPLHLFGTVGTLLAFAGFLIDLWVTYDKLVNGIPLSNRPILLLGVLLILVGVQLVSLGLLGEMIVKNSFTRGSMNYQKEKGRPSAEARERRASQAARVGRIAGRTPRPGGPRAGGSRPGSRDKQV